MTVSDWLQERYENCLRIAKTKAGAEQQGWLNDAAYFRQARIICEALDKSHADQHSNIPIRMYIAIRVLRAWNHGAAGYSATILQTVNNWIDSGMCGPIPWPDCPFFNEWASKNGFQNCDGKIGFKFTVKLDDSEEKAWSGQ